MTIKSSSNLPLAESFYSVQGEGFYSGVAAYFIRLAGCKVGCAWCDSKAAWSAQGVAAVPTARIAAQAAQTPARIAVVTGGEPLLYNLDKLCNLLKINKLSTHLETSGTQPLSGAWDWITLSPKRHSLPLANVLRAADALKIVITGENDFAFAESQAEQCKPDCCLFLQPEWERRQDVIPLIINYLQQRPQWRLSLQLHKLIGIN